MSCKLKAVLPSVYGLSRTDMDRHGLTRTFTDFHGQSRTDMDRHGTCTDRCGWAERGADSGDRLAGTALADLFGLPDCFRGKIEAEE